ncbi:MULTISPECIES: sugar ABC transporter ATP-binding protein [unclassified Micromonospora]|uniref:sugar ABC transporter ATP-binding protein n=1 Tax=unclassified Micromonospora TaxID=2617518 RepID=UPI0036398B46
MTSSAVALQTRGLSKRYGGVVALAGVDVTIHAGQVTALLGENGAGKSTLVACCSGAAVADAGEIRLHGEVRSFPTPRAAAAAGVAVVHQEPQMLEHQSVAQNLYISDLAGGARRVASRARLEQRAEEQLARLGLAGVLDPRQTTSTLSGAKRQLVEIARALLTSPTVLFLDEPNASLGDEETEQLFSVVRRLRESGVAVVLVSHRLTEVYRIADRVVIMRDGRKVADGTVRDIPLDAAVARMGGRPRNERGHQAPRAAAAGSGEAVFELRDASGRGFRHVDLTLRPGEILGMAGLVGAGRTEIALGAIGATPLRSGQVLVDGQRRRLRSPSDALAHGVVYIAEDRKDALFYDKSVGFNIRASLLGPSRNTVPRPREGEARQLAGRLAQRLAVKAPSLATLARGLSGGNQQKLLFARAVSVRPRVLILDEPTHGVDIGSRAETHELIRQLADEGIAIWMISSELDEILDLATRIVVVRDGRIQTEVPAGHDPTPILAAALGATAAANRS